ncbi:S1 RNA-binding domain-containing protein [Aneurinibacillus sp. Ricciae_BoGa-3]|uniref:S1 RNA-binding domain-containing protein n=1 Tax=Aneurinibacillus sp. Ricciae_BoGa-3 TaxID=3022697 RepID=UPI0023401367|nr:S1 RNA-binding domain-containing protein [Aneurinibacillus sp. Ricciae_BoGa-3]WCK52744.1 S1 RNA-binding domain-containing protein [Aneurinibacillus sp. Ricciae_BoGa-3]
MSNIAVGNIIEGTVVGVQSFGAFVNIGENKQGLVHISQVASSYVEDINQFVKVGDKVTVKVLEIKDDGKISLTMRINEEKKEERRPFKKRDDRRGGPRGGDQGGKEDFESMMKKWMKTSEDKMGDLGKREKRR